MVQKSSADEEAKRARGHQMSAPISAPAVTTVSLVAPVTGVLVPIEQVPDPVFAQKMVGEGISIDPLSNVLVAPCDGEVIHIHPAAHALTIRSADGVDGSRGGRADARYGDHRADR